MPPTYEKQLLDKIAQLSEENNKMLKSLRRGARWGAFFGLLKWAIIIIPIVWAYFLLQPYYGGSFKETSNNIINQVRSLQGINIGFDQIKEDQKQEATKQEEVQP